MMVILILFIAVPICSLCAKSFENIHPKINKNKFHWQILNGELRNACSLAHSLSHTNTFISSIAHIKHALLCIFIS